MESARLFAPEQKHIEQQIFELARFDYSNYYVIDFDAEINKRFVLLKRQDHDNEGMLLLADYYKYKYNANIIAHNVQPFQIQIHEFISTKAFAEIRQSDRNYRVAFIGGCAEHSVPVIYIKEGKKEAFLVSCSKGMKSPATLLADKTGITCFYVPFLRQADKYSCHADAVVCAVVATELDPITGEYVIPNLLTRLEERSASMSNEENSKVKEVKLIDELLITAQLAKFIEYHAEKNSTIIVHHDEQHNETREQFAIRYKLEGRNGYIYLKGIKLTSIIEIQFYANQLEKILGSLWTKALHDQFIKNAKKELKNLGSIITGKEKFWQSGPSRKTLHDFTKDFVKGILPSAKIEDIKHKVKIDPLASI